MSDEILLKLLGNVGVPAAVCFIMLYRVSPAIEKLTEAINSLGNDIDKRLDNVEKECRELRYQMDAILNGRHKIGENNHVN